MTMRTCSQTAILETPGLGREAVRSVPCRPV